MPIYEYRCDRCGHEFEREQPITADPVKTCPECKSRRVKRLISQTSFVLKGGGWYSDLYSKDSGKKSDDKKTSSAGDSSTPESKPPKESGDKTSGGKKDTGKKSSKSSKNAA